MNEAPSFTKQTKWKSGLLAVPNAYNNNRYFNPTIVNRPDGTDWLIARHASPAKPNSPLPRIGMNDLVAFRVTKDYALTQATPVQFPKRFKDEHFEDPRASVIGGRVCISCTNFQLIRGLPWRGSHQIFAVVGEDWRVVSRIDPVYGLNGASPYVQRGNEKNWLWFQHDKAHHMVYTAIPHQVAVFRGQSGAERTYATSLASEPWKHGTPRGGSPPVLVGDEYWSFFHSSLPWKDKKRRYYMGAYAFKAEPPFHITRMTAAPLLTGSQNDPWSPNLPLVIFPGGALFRNGRWIVVFGVNDCACGWIEIPQAELLKLALPVKSREIDEYFDVAGNPMSVHGLEPETGKVTLVPV